jgi:hypothetical protein
MRLLSPALLALLVALPPPVSGKAASLKTERLSAATYARAVQNITCENAPSLSSLGSYLPMALKKIALSQKLDATGNLVRDEYETTAQYQERVEEFWGSAFGRSNRIFVARELSPLEISYNADDGSMYVTHIFSPLTKSQRGLAVQIFFGERRSSSEQVQNVFGAKTTLTRESHVTGNLVLDPATKVTRHPRFVRGRMFEDEAGFSFPLSVDQAKLLKREPTMLLVGKLHKPVPAIGFKRFQATFQDPTDTTIRIFDFTVEAECLIFLAGNKQVGVIDFRNGAVP